MKSMGNMESVKKYLLALGILVVLASACLCPALTGTGASTLYLIGGAGNVSIGTSEAGNLLLVEGTIESRTGDFMFSDGTVQHTLAILPTGGTMTGTLTNTAGVALSFAKITNVGTSGAYFDGPNIGYVNIKDGVTEGSAETFATNIAKAQELTAEVAAIAKDVTSVATSTAYTNAQLITAENYAIAKDVVTETTAETYCESRVLTAETYAIAKDVVSVATAETYCESRVLTAEAACVLKAGDTMTGGLVITSTVGALTLPRMTTAQKFAIASQVAGMAVYDTTLAKISIRTATTWETVTSN